MQVSPINDDIESDDKSHESKSSFHVPFSERPVESHEIMLEIPDINRYNLVNIREQIDRISILESEHKVNRTPSGIFYPFLEANYDVETML